MIEESKNTQSAESEEFEWTYSGTPLSSEEIAEVTAEIRF